MLEQGKISGRQLFFLTLGFLHGTSAIFSRSAQAREDIWAAVLMAGAGGLLLICLYTALAGRFPEESPPRYARRILGRPLGTAVGLLYFWYALHVGALVLRSLGEVMTVNFYLQTPILVFALSTVFLTTFAVRPGIEVPARAAEFIVPFSPILLMPLILLLTVASGIVHLENLTPILAAGPGPVLQGTWSFLAIPYGELVFSLFIFPALHVPAKARRATALAVIFCSFYLTLCQSLDVAVLGAEASRVEFFPSLIAVTMIQIGDFLTRIEALIMLLWVSAIFIKLTVCQYVATLALAESLDLREFHSLATAVGALMIALSMLVFPDAPSLVAFLHRYFPFYSLPFYLLLPLLLWAVAKLRGLPGNPAPSQKEQTTRSAEEAHQPAPPAKPARGGEACAL